MGVETYTDHYNRCKYTQVHPNEALADICGQYPSNSTFVSETVRTSYLECNQQVNFYRDTDSCRRTAIELCALDALKSPLGILALGYMCSQGARLLGRALFFSQQSYCQRITKGIVGTVILGTTLMGGGMKAAAVAAVFLSIYEIQSAMAPRREPEHHAARCEKAPKAAQPQQGDGPSEPPNPEGDAS